LHLHQLKTPKKGATVSSTSVKNNLNINKENNKRKFNYIQIFLNNFKERATVKKGINGDSLTVIQFPTSFFTFYRKNSEATSKQNVTEL